MKNRPIGIFDSGVGGLTVLKEIEKELPYENIVYLGDTARVPYGNKSKSTIIKFSTENILFLLQKKVKAVVIACNTSSSLALDYLTKIFNVPIFGVIEPGVLKAVNSTKNKKVGVIGTRSTINSLSYQKKIVSLNPKIKVFAKPCPLFVPLVEEGILKGNIVKEVISMYLEEFKQKKVDTLILGCTHYPLIKKEIQNYLNGVYIVDSAREVAVYTKDLLLKHNLLNEKKDKPKKEFYVSDEPYGFAKLAKLFLKREIEVPKLMDYV